MNRSLLLRSIQRQMGKTRDQLLYGRRNRHLAAAAEAVRSGWLARASDALTPLAPPPANPAIEVHSLCGEGQRFMGLWSSWSLLRFLPEARLVVHSDGSLTEASLAYWAERVPGLRVVTPEESRDLMQTHLADFPQILDWSEKYHFGRMIGGYYTALRTPRMVEMDTDTLTFRTPEALRTALGPDGHLMSWNRGNAYSYAYPLPVLEAALGDLATPLPERVNGGFMASFRFGPTQWGLLDEAVRRLAAHPDTDHLRYWVHQTLMAVLAKSLGEQARELPSNYAIHMGPTAPDAVMRHFVGNPGVRPRFYTEGIAMVIADARNRGQLPEDTLRDVCP